jgi:tetratricopeptide (TPR) repeat protein
VMKAMSADKADRYQSVAALQADLAAYETFGRTSAYVPSLPETIHKWGRRNPTKAVAVTLTTVFLLLLAGVIVFARIKYERDTLAGEKDAAEAKADAAEAKADAEIEQQRRLTAEMQLKAKQGEIDELLGMLNVETRRDAEDAAAALIERFQQARREGRSDAQIVAQLDRAEIDSALRAFARRFDAHAHYPEAVEVSADDYYYRGLLHTLARRDSAAAIADFTRATELDPAHARAWINLGVLRSRLGDFDRAMADYDRGIALNSEMPLAFLNRGTLHARRGDFEPAIADFTAAIDLDNDYVDAWYNRGVMYGRLGDGKRALADFRRVLELEPGHVRARISVSSLLSAHSQKEAALVEIERAVKADPRNARALAERARLLAAHDRLDDAVRDYRAAIEQDPTSMTAWRGLVNLLWHGNKADEALEVANAAVLANPDDVDARLQRGMLRLFKGRFAEAERDLTIVIERGGSPAHALLARAQARMSQENYQAALDDYEAAVERSPRSWQCHIGLAQALSALGRADEAAAAFEVGRRLAPPRMREILDRVRDAMAADGASGARQWSAELPPLQLPGAGIRPPRAASERDSAADE